MSDTSKQVNYMRWWTWIIWVICVLGLILFAAAYLKADPPKNFEVTFTVTYNSMNLETAAAKEKMFRDLFKDACSIDVKVQDKRVQLTPWSNGLVDTMTFHNHFFVDTLKPGILQLK